MNRRALLASCATVSLAGCAGELPGLSGSTTVSTRKLPTDVVASNHGDGPRELRVTVRDGDRVVFEEEWLLKGSRRLSNVVEEPGTYTVEVETADGRHRRTEWRVRPTFGEVRVEFEYGQLSVVQSTDCYPDCDPLSAETRGSVPFRDEDDRRLHYPAVVHLESGTDDRETVHLEVRHEDALAVAGTYEVPPGMRLAVGPLRSLGTYQVTAEADGDAATSEWYAVDGSRLLATVGDGVSLTCGPPRTALGLYSDDETPARTVTVTATREGTDEQVARQRFTVEPDAERTVADFLPGHGSYRLHARTEDGQTAEKAIRTCPPWFHSKVAFNEEGSVRIVQGRPV